LNPERPEFPESFRGKGPSRNKQHKFRIVCLGGSTTFGHELKAEEAWPAVTERVLRSKGIDAEVINAGVQGYGSRQLLVHYRKDIASLQPDYVVIYEGWNRTGALVDPEGWLAFGLGTGQPGKKRSRLEVYLLRHSLVLQRIYTWVAKRRAGKPNLSTATYKIDPYDDVFVRDFRELVEEIQAHRQYPVLVLYPALYFPGMTAQERSIFEPMLWSHRAFQEAMLTELERKHEDLRALAQSTGTPLVDVQGAFSSSRGWERAALFMDEMHLTVRGNQKAGEVIANCLADLIFRGNASADGKSRRMESVPGLTPTRSGSTTCETAAR
jgi:lysophospholipase L1-like esterase